MTKFKVGDRVKATNDTPIGETGTVVNAGVTYLVDFETWRDGHNDSGQKGEDYKGFWYLCEEELELTTPTEKSLTLGRSQVIALCKTLSDASRKIDAIKMWRLFSGAGLKESKDFIENGCKEPDKEFSVGDTVNVYGERRTVIAKAGRGAFLVYWLKDLHDTYDTYSATSVTAY